MGKAVILQDCDFSGAGLGRVTLQGDVPIETLNISGPAEVTGASSAARYKPTFTPVVTTERNVSWSVVSGSEYATIDPLTGVLSVLEGADENNIIIRCTSVSDPAITADKVVVVTYYEEASGYITTGLIAHWDGIEKNNNGDSWKWVDLIGNIVATARNAAVFGEGNDYAEFSGGNYMTLGSNISVTDSNYTIEICYEKTTSPGKEALFLSGKSASDAYAVFATWGASAGDYIITGRNSSEQKCWVNNAVYPQTASVVNQQKCFINGVSQNLSASSNYLNGNQQTIAAAGNGTNPFTGKIYSIRIYNRALTDAEISNNQNYDRIRFGI